MLDASAPQLRHTYVVLKEGMVRSPEWYAARRRGIGASDMAGILGLSTYSSPYSLYWEKVSDEWPAIEETMAMRLGRSDELGIAEVIQDRYPGWTVNDPPGSLFRSLNMAPAWMLATPDRLLTVTAGTPDDQLAALIGPEAMENKTSWATQAQGLAIPLEMKSVQSAKGWGKPGTDEVPLMYAVQLLQQCIVFGAPFGILSARIGKRIQDYVIRRDQHNTLTRSMLVEGERFMEHVKHRVEPVVDGHEATTRALQKLYPGDTTDVDIPDPVQLPAQWLADIRRLQEKAKRDKAELDALKNQVRERLGSARVGVNQYGEPVAKRTVYDRRSYSVKACVIDRIDFSNSDESEK